MRIMKYNMASDKKYDFSEHYRDIFNGRFPEIERDMYVAYVPKKDDSEIVEIIYSPYAINYMGLMNEPTLKLVTERC